MSSSFTNQVVLITGGGTGIGAATALAIAQAGGRVVITGRSKQTLDESAARHKAIEAFVADVSDAKAVGRCIDHIRSAYGRLDHLINNAGILELAALADASADHVERTFRINVAGLIETTRQALPMLRASKGSITNVSSIAADKAFANMSVYSASKAAVLALTRVWAKELAADGVRVNAVSPGPIETPIFSTEKLGVSDQQLGEMGGAIQSQVPLGRFGKPEEVASVVQFLSSAAAAFVTGTQYSVSGGIEA
jgi:NAD(P)-dependent dehydrogenase (short-subunit alcohol dehydrogenase family)